MQAAAIERLRRFRLPFTLSKASLILPASIWFAWWAGAAIGNGSRHDLLLGLGVVGLVGPVVYHLVARRLPAAVLAVEMPICLVLLSTLVLRQRSAADLAYNPLDPAAQFRVACVVFAGALGAIALASDRVDATSPRWRMTSRPFRLYVAYTLVVFAAAPYSVNPGLTSYRGIELLAGVLVLLGAVKAVGREAITRVGATLFWFTVALVLSVWLGVILYPSEAIGHFANTYVPIQFQVSGVNPVLSSNTVGLLGVIVAVWSLARGRWGGRPGSLKPVTAGALVLLGSVTLLVAQYRTGYLAFLISVVVYLVIRRKWWIAWSLILFAIVVIMLVPDIVDLAEPYVLRGQTVEQAKELSSRIDWWARAVDVWRTSPIIGRGLLTASRFEVLQPLGLNFTAGIHSTWVEALVGTGLLGLILLGVAALITLSRSVVGLLARGGSLAPLLLMMVILIRSVTGTTIESFGHVCLIFLWLALALEDRGAPYESDLDQA